MMIIRIVDGDNDYDDHNDDNVDGDVKIIPVMLVIKTSSNDECSQDIRVGGAVNWGGGGGGVGGRERQRQSQRQTDRQTDRDNNCPPV